MDLVMREINTHPERYNCTAHYGGLRDYVQAVNALGLTWPVLDQTHPLANGNRDFHPYTTCHTMGTQTCGLVTTPVVQSSKAIFVLGKFVAPCKLTLTMASLGLPDRSIKGRAEALTDNSTAPGSWSVSTPYDAERRSNLYPMTT